MLGKDYASIKVGELAGGSLKCRINAMLSVFDSRFGLCNKIRVCKTVCRTVQDFHV